MSVQIIPPESRELRMPAGMPLGLGFLGAARFAAIRRVLEHATRAANAKAYYHAAEGAVATSLVNREVAREQLRNVDTIRQEAADQIVEGACIVRLERKLKAMELEDRIAEREANRERSAAARQPAEVPKAAKPSRDAFQDLMEDLRGIPELAKTATAVKEQIVREAGGEEKLNESHRAMIETIDSIVASAVSKQAEDKIL